MSDNPHVHGKPNIVPVEGLIIDYSKEKVYRYRKPNEYPNKYLFERTANWYDYNPVIEIKEKLNAYK
jgi:hypothetical protein